MAAAKSNQHQGRALRLRPSFRTTAIIAGEIIGKPAYRIAARSGFTSWITKIALLRILMTAIQLRHSLRSGPLRSNLKSFRTSFDEAASSLLVVT